MANRSEKPHRREAAPSPPPQPAPRAVPRRATAERRLRILERLTTGLTVAHIAREEGLSVRRIRCIIQEMLASREIDPAAGFVQLQIARVNEAMIVARTMMMDGDLQAMDRLIRLTGELDRYHGFAPSQIPAFGGAAPPRRTREPRRELPAPNATREAAEAELFLVASP
jgi:transposase-like protein